jgi:hypothetical protein
MPGSDVRVPCGGIDGKLIFDGVEALDGQAGTCLVLPHPTAGDFYCGIRAHHRKGPAREPECCVLEPVLDDVATFFLSFLVSCSDATRRSARALPACLVLDSPPNGALLKRSSVVVFEYARYVARLP